MSDKAQFYVGQLVSHRLFHYRGVIVDVDARFMLSEHWYEVMAKTRPPKDEPWYRVLVHRAAHETYVAQRNLEADSSENPIDHPDVDRHFVGFSAGRYLTGKRVN